MRDPDVDSAVGHPVASAGGAGLSSSGATTVLWCSGTNSAPVATARSPFISSGAATSVGFRSPPRLFLGLTGFFHGVGAAQ